MKKLILIYCIVSLISSAAICQKKVKCVIETEKGPIEIVLYPKKAPVTVANFLKYVDSGRYENSSFFRVCTPQNEADREIKIEVIQGGNVQEGADYEPINIETTEKTGILHKNGTVSMARSDPNSATSSFFICINDQPELDFKGKRNPDGYGFAAFGKVTKGMNVVLEIQKGENEGQMLLDPVLIRTVKRK